MAGMAFQEGVQLAMIFAIFVRGAGELLLIVCIELSYCDSKIRQL